MAPKRKTNRRQTPVKQRSTTPRKRTRIVDPDDYDLEEIEDDAAAAAPIDQLDEPGHDLDRALTLFVRRPPTGADHIAVWATTMHGDQLIQDRLASEAREDPTGTANLILDSARQWATVEGRRTMFRILWQAGDRTLGAYQLACGTGDSNQLDGSVNSFLSQQQRHAEVQHRLQHQGFELAQDAWARLQSASMQRIEALEKDNAALRERLRKAGDIDAEIAFSTVAADLEQRARRTEIFEARVLPMVQQLIMAKLLNADGGSNGDIVSQLLSSFSPKAPATEDAAPADSTSTPTPPASSST